MEDKEARKESKRGEQEMGQRVVHSALVVTCSLYPVTRRCVTSFHRFTKGLSIGQVYQLCLYTLVPRTP